ncbi:hypothetical protein LTS10_010360 [Elasticomyces elasticus]|nr:hypothetical protein LTS10_010360 [Elasticomyces elasticus]
MHGIRPLNVSSKPDSVQSFLDRLNKSSVRTEVLAALAVQSSDTIRSTDLQVKQSEPQQTDQEVSQQRPPTHHGILSPDHSEPTNSVDDHIYSPLEIVAAVVKPDNTHPLQQSSADGVGGANNRKTTFSSGRVFYASSQLPFGGGDRLASYFATSIATSSDWEELAEQSPQGTLQERPSIYDLLSSRLLDDSDAAYTFDL